MRSIKVKEPQRIISNCLYYWGMPKSIADSNAVFVSGILIDNHLVMIEPDDKWVLKWESSSNAGNVVLYYTNQDISVFDITRATGFTSKEEAEKHRDEVAKNNPLFYGFQAVEAKDD